MPPNALDTFELVALNLLKHEPAQRFEETANQEANQSILEEWLINQIKALDLGVLRIVPQKAAILPGGLFCLTGKIEET